MRLRLLDVASLCQSKYGPDRSCRVVKVMATYKHQKTDGIQQNRLVLLAAAPRHRCMRYWREWREFGMIS